jgi:RNA polymerase sigma-70 factor (ECF subfamily)
MEEICSLMADQDSTNTDRLLQRATTGDAVAVNELISNHRRYLRKIVDLRMEDELRVRIDPSDVVQEIQFAASQRMDDFLLSRPASFRIWLRRKALDQLVDLQRRHVNAAKRSVRREVKISDRSSMAIARGLFVAAPSQQLRRKEQTAQVHAALESMSESDREVLLLRHAEELTNSEVAEVLNIDAASASQRYGRALRRLRKKLTTTEGGHDE